MALAWLRYLHLVYTLKPGVRWSRHWFLCDDIPIEHWWASRRDAKFHIQRGARLGVQSVYLRQWLDDGEKSGEHWVTYSAGKFLSH